MVRSIEAADPCGNSDAAIMSSFLSSDPLAFRGREKRMKASHGACERWISH
jgi:hypothetical protein